jgi:hypothetical protein
MNKMVMIAVLIAVGYVMGIKFPQIAQKIGLA